MFQKNSKATGLEPQLKVAVFNVSFSLIFIYTHPKLSGKDIKTLRRQKRNRLPIEKLTDKFKGDEMVRAIRRCLRHRQESTRSKGTSQSRYKCLFVNCGHAMHADENAAINIGYKWITEKLVH